MSIYSVDFGIIGEEGEGSDEGSDKGSDEGDEGEGDKEEGNEGVSDDRAWCRD